MDTTDQIEALRTANQGFCDNTYCVAWDERAP